MRTWWGPGVGVLREVRIMGEPMAGTTRALWVDIFEVGCVEGYLEREFSDFKIFEKD